jgi:hypothetical protein
MKHSWKIIILRACAPLQLVIGSELSYLIFLELQPVLVHFQELAYSSQEANNSCQTNQLSLIPFCYHTAIHHLNFLIQSDSSILA